MKKEPNKKRIGVFVVLGFLVLFLLAGNSIWSKLTERDEIVWVMYFDESIKGLNVGSPVVFRGVEIGKVSNIELYINPDDLNVRIPVYAKMKPNHYFGSRMSSDKESREVFQTLIDRGLRARLITQSYLTGQLMIELEMLPNTPIEYEQPKWSHLPEVPTALSPIGELSKGLQRLPLQQIVTKLDNILTSIQKDMPDISEILKTINKTTMQNSNKIADTMVNINRTLIDVADMAKALRDMADYLERHPESILKGKRED